MSETDSTSAPQLQCGKCKLFKLPDEFYKNSNRKTGRNFACKQCYKDRYLERRQEILENRKAEYPSRKAAKLEYNRQYVARNKLRTAEYQRLYKELNADKLREYFKQRYRDNRDEFREQYQARYQDKRHEFILKSRLSREEIKQRTPGWLTDDDFRRIAARYKEAKWMTDHTGIKHHVDHIVPLRGENVCGLHVPANLRVITAAHNFAKSNRFN